MLLAPGAARTPLAESSSAETGSCLPEHPFNSLVPCHSSAACVCSCSSSPGSAQDHTRTTAREGAACGQRTYDSCQRCHSLGKTQCFASCLGWTRKREERRYHGRHGSIAYAHDAQCDQQQRQVRTPWK